MTRWLFTGKQFAFSLTCGLLLLATLASPANAAIQFQIAGSGNGFTTIGTGYGKDADENHETLLDVTFNYIGPIEPGENPFTLNAGGTKTFTFGTITMNEKDEKGGITVNEKDNLDVTATLVFVAPPSGNVDSQATVEVDINGSVSDNATDLTLSFNPVEVTFGNGGKFSVSFNTLAFNTQEELYLKATVTLLNEPIAESAVPEPASLVTWGALGVVGLVLGKRRRILQSTESQTL